MKSVWEGSIAFGLVDIPIRIYSASEPRSVSFKMLCKKCDSPIKYKRVCDGCKKEVAWQDILYGLKVGKKYKTFTRDELKDLKPEKSEVADVISFVETSEIDPIYFQKSYYLGPAPKKEKAFSLFKEVLREEAKMAVIRIIMRNKEYIAVVRPYKNILLMTTLLYENEIRKPEISFAKPALSQEELTLASQIIKKYAKKDFDIEDYEDRFAEKIKDIILGKTVKVKKAKEPKPEKLIEALKLSVK